MGKGCLVVSFGARFINGVFLVLGLVNTMLRLGIA